MSYSFSPESGNMTYGEFFFTIKHISKLVENHGDRIKLYLNMMRSIQGWEVFFEPSVVITEVNNKNMGHIYLGKVRVPVSFSKMVGSNNQPAPHVITFVVCKYAELPGAENEEERRNRARRIALKKLSEHYPKRFQGMAEDDFEKQKDFIEVIRQFQERIEEVY